MICFPNAKINLGLYVTNKREDGMHDIETCYVPIPLYDVIEILPSKKFEYLHYGLPMAVNQEDNLIIKAWKLISTIKKDIAPVKICTYKNIPIGSGLGGGSSDAAFLLKAINKIASLGLQTHELQKLAFNIGADCPFFIINKPTLATGIGNIFSPIANPVLNKHITIIFPDFSISTKNAFEKIIPTKNNNLKKVIANQASWKNNLINDFEAMSLTDYPKLQSIKNTLYKLGAQYVSLTGSGSAIYAISTKPLNTGIFNNDYWVWSQPTIYN